MPYILLQGFNIPEKVFVSVHMKKYSFRARHDISNSSFRVNLGAGLAPLLFDEGKRIKAVFKLLNGCFEIFIQAHKNIR